MENLGVSIPSSISSSDRSCCFSSSVYTLNPYALEDLTSVVLCVIDLLICVFVRSNLDRDPGFCSGFVVLLFVIPLVSGLSLRLFLTM